MSTTLTQPTPDTLGTTEGAPGARPQALSSADGSALLATHALVVLAFALLTPALVVSPDQRAYADLLLLALIAVPAIVLATQRSPHRMWWVVGAPLASAAYLWLPSITGGSVYAEASAVALSALLVFGPLFSVAAPLIVLWHVLPGHQGASAAFLVGCGLAGVMAPALVYAALVYPLSM